MGGSDRYHLSICVFIVKTEGYNVTVLSYVHVRICMLEKPKKAACMSVFKGAILTPMQSPEQDSVANIPICFYLYVAKCLRLYECVRVKAVQLRIRT